MLRVSTSAGRSLVSARSMRDRRARRSRRSGPDRCGPSSTSSSISRSTRATSPRSPATLISLPRTWMSASNSRSMMPRNSSRGPRTATTGTLLGITIVCRGTVGSVMCCLSSCHHATGTVGPHSSGIRIRPTSDAAIAADRVRTYAPSATGLFRVARASPGGQVNARPPSTCTWAWKTVCWAGGAVVADQPVAVADPLVDRPPARASGEHGDRVRRDVTRPARPASARAPWGSRARASAPAG